MRLKHGINDKMKITAELTNIIKRDVAWGDSFERNVTDIFSVQDEVALNIVNNLDMKISSNDRESIAIDPTSNVKVYDRLAKAKANAKAFSRNPHQRKHVHAPSYRGGYAKHSELQKNDSLLKEYYNILLRSCLITKHNRVMS